MKYHIGIFKRISNGDRMKLVEVVVVIVMMVIRDDGDK